VPKNILIFSDGTGQYGGLAPDQRLSNVYKMYRAMRPGPDSSISPQDQIAFYDAGLGTSERAGNLLQRMRTVAGSAFGTGISENIVDCYEAILQHWSPGDRVFLFGFSRGAYTARCVANTMNLCGIPTVMADGKPVPKHGPALREIAEKAVYTVYEHGSGKNRQEFEVEREEQARRFRDQYGSAGLGLDGEDQGNVAPEFIGVFDTVASLGSTIARRILWAALIVSLAVSGFAFWLNANLLAALAALPALAIMLTLVRTFRRQLKVIRDWPTKGRSSSHFASWNLKFYDRFLDTNVGYARHALAIDENRRRFPYVPWGRSSDVQRKCGSPAITRILAAAIQKLNQGCRTSRWTG
jgi:pimeloyl-ACP methyl ester carboxylesterase